MRGFLRRVGKSESGTSAVEFALVLPVFLTILYGIVQFGLVFMAQNNMTNAAREAARAMAVTGTSANQAETMAQNLLSQGLNYQYVVNAVPPDPTDPNDNDVTVTVTMDTSQIAFGQLISMFQGGNISTQVVMRQE
jgi:Flp pilus assembly protein TadG